MRLPSLSQAKSGLGRETERDMETKRLGESARERERERKGLIGTSAASYGTCNVTTLEPLSVRFQISSIRLPFCVERNWWSISFSVPVEPRYCWLTGCVINNRLIDEHLGIKLKNKRAWLVHAISSLSWLLKFLAYLWLFFFEIFFQIEKLLED